MVLDQDLVRSLFDYDAATGQLIWRYRDGAPKQWNVRYAGKVAGRVCERGYVKIRLFGKANYAHTLVWIWHNGKQRTRCVDHVNRVKSDNRIENLREATNSQNLANWDRDGMRGVSFNSRYKKFVAQMVVEGKHHWLGMHDTAEQARTAYVTKANELLGEFACARI